MPLAPEVAEDILVLLDKYPDLTVVQRAIIKSAAAYLVRDEMDRLIAGGGSDESEAFAPRLKMNFEEYNMVPGRVELENGIVRPIDWETPNGLAAVELQNRKWDQEIKALIASGMSKTEAHREYYSRHYPRDFS